MAPPGRVRFRSIDKAGIGRDLDREITRKTRFDDRQDVPKSRLDRSKIQRDEYIDFKNDPTKTKAVNIIDPVTGKVTGTVTNLFQAATPGGKTLAEKEMELAQKYGPTMSEIAGDITYRSGKIVGALGEKALSGGLGFLAVVKDIVDYATNTGNKNYDKLNDVEKEIYDNPDKHPLTSKGLPSLKKIAQSTDLINEAEKDALGLQLDRLIANRNFTATPGTGYQAGAGLTTLPTPEISIDFPTRDPVFPSEQIKQSALDRFSPEYLAEQKRQLDKLNELKQVEELSPEGSPSGDFLFPESYTIPFTEIEIPSLMRKAEEFVTDGKGFNVTGNTGVTRDEEGSGNLRLNLDDQASITQYNNPFNLEFKGQEGAEPAYGGETGQRFASFDTLDRGLKTGINRVAEIVGDGRTTEGFLDIYAPREDNPKSFDNYLASLEKEVGPTIEPNEIKDLTKGVIRFENTRDIADQYLDYLQRENDRIYGGIIS